MTDNTPRWMKDAGEFGAGSGFPERGIGMQQSDIERLVAETLGRAVAAETIGEASDVLHRLAHHEAGHAVVGRALGLPLRGIEIDVRHGGVNRFHSAQAPDGWSPTDDAAILMAGVIAERRAFPATTLEGCEDDENALLALMSREQAPDVAWARGTAEAILDQRRAGYERLVDALIRQRSLTGDEVDALLDDGDVEHRAFVERMESRIRAGVAGRSPVLRDLDGRDVSHEVRGAVEAVQRRGGERSIVREFTFTPCVLPGAE